MGPTRSRDSQLSVPFCFGFTPSCESLLLCAIVLTGFQFVLFAV